VSHANAALTPRARLKIGRLIVDEGWPVARAAERFDVSWPDLSGASLAAPMTTARPHRRSHRCLNHLGSVDQM